MDPRIENLKSTTFLGKRLTRRRIADIQGIVAMLPKLSRRELGETVCVQMQWQTPKGSNRIQFALRVLEELERLGILALPALDAASGPRRQRPVEATERTAPGPPLAGPLADFAPVTLQAASEPAAVAEWNEWVDRYHPLGYRRPMGPHLRYFLRDRAGRKLGCLLFGFAARDIACRDAWIGWQEPERRKRLDLVVGNSRFLLFPWVRVKHLASHALGLALRQLPADWRQRHGYEPVLVETFIDPRQHAGTCYRASNWQCLGQTKGRPASGDAPAKTPKDVWVHPLRRDWRAILLHGPQAAARSRRPAPAARAERAAAAEAEAEDRFARMWQEILAAVTAVAADHDRQWMRRQRAINTLLVVLFVFRLAFAPRRGYPATLSALWEQCRRLGVALPRPQPVAASSMCAARAKVDEEVFRRIHGAVLDRAPRDRPADLWRGRRVFAVDGCKLNLPRPLAAAGYDPPAAAHYPQGLLSCLYQLRARLPVDFDLHAHADERRAALRHLPALQRGDVVVYDRGYYSFELLHAHAERGLDAVFRLQRNASSLFRAFVESDRSEDAVTVRPSAEAARRNARAALRPCRARLVKYVVGETEYVLATTLLDAQRYPVQALSDLYHGRWGIEELYKVAKVFLEIEDFHSRSERGVKQELFARFGLIAMTRLFADRAERGAAFRARPGEHGKPGLQANFKHALSVVGQALEGLFAQQAATLARAAGEIANAIARCRQRRRPRRSYPRRSLKPAPKWRPSKKAAAATAA